MTRYRAASYSHTVDTIVFADGSSARTDLIRLNPNIEAYSLDFTGVAPTRPSRYAADTGGGSAPAGSEAHEAEVDWILRNSHPTLSTTTLSARLRAAGYPLGAQHRRARGDRRHAGRDLVPSNGLELDTRAQRADRVSKDAMRVTVEFDGERQLAGYTATVSTAGGATLSLQKSADGQEWEDVAASMVTAGPGGGEVTRSLGVGSTVSHSRFGRHGGGHSHYRLLVSGGEILGEVSFRLHGARFSNAEPIVYLYRYLLAGARAGANRSSRHRWWLPTPSSTAQSSAVPAEATASAALEVSAGSLLHRNGNPVDAPPQPGAKFFIRPGTGFARVTVTAKVPGTPTASADGHHRRGARRARRTLHPLAFAVPAQLVVSSISTGPLRFRRLDCGPIAGVRWRRGAVQQRSADVLVLPPDRVVNGVRVRALRQ